MARIGFVSASLAWRAPDGTVWTNAGLGRLVEAVAARSAKLVVALSSTPTRQDQHDHALRLPRHALHFLPAMPSIRHGFSAGAACHRVVQHVEAETDAVIVQLPFSAPAALYEPKRPRVYHVCSDVRGLVRASRNYRGLWRTVAVTAAFLIEAMQKTLVQTEGARVVTNGAALRALFPRSHGRAIVSSALRRDEIASVSRRRAPGAPFTVLFVGFLRSEKGIDLLVEAFRRLLVRVPDARLEIVGGVDSEELGAAEVARRALADLVDAGRAVLVGALPFGQALFQRYADADVLVLPSRSEGTPRVLIEARAFGCPVVATRVGGIPSSVQDGVDGLLVGADAVDELTDAIDRIRTDRGLRERLIKNGLQRALETTVDAQADALIAEADSVVAGLPTHRVDRT